MELDYPNLVRISNQIGVSPRVLERFLFTLSAKKQPVQQLELQRAFGLPKSVLKQIRELLDNVVVTEGDYYSLSPDCLGRVEEIQISREEKNTRILETLTEWNVRLTQIENERKRSERGIDQFRTLPESVINRVEYLYEKGELEERALLFMGDNDLTSVVAAATRLPKRITVLDIDEGLLDLIHNLNETYTLDIQGNLYDARDNFPEKLKQGFDVGVSDPPYTLPGIELFLSRCIQGIGRGNGAILLSYGFSTRSRERALPIQIALTEMGLVLEEVLPGFNRYYAAQSIGCQSSLYLCRCSPKTAPAIRGKFHGSIYTKQPPNR